jgi:hypothetical protein
MVKESAEYDNYLSKENRLNDKYRSSLEAIFGEVIETPIIDNTKAKKSNDPDLWKKVYVHFRTTEDIIDFCKRIGHAVDYQTKEVWYPLASASALFESAQDPIDHVDARLVAPRKKSKPKTDDNAEWRKHWVGMPEFVQEENPSHRTITVKFRNENDLNNFSKRIDQELSEKTNAIWHPKLDRTPNFLLRWIEE